MFFGLNFLELTGLIWWGYYCSKFIWKINRIVKEERQLQNKTEVKIIAEEANRELVKHKN